MKLALALALLAAGGFGAWRATGGPCPLALCFGERAAACREPAPDGVTGRYVEARTASVFAGACHYNGERPTEGREAVLAWRFDGGEVDGVDLAGLGAVAVVAADRNLADEGARRRSVVYLDEGLGERERGALLAHLRAEHGERLGAIEAVTLDEVRVAFQGERYDVRVGERVELRGAAMPDRACCTMPFQVWYQPEAELEGRLVGNSEAFAFRDEVLGPVWSISGQNDAFLGRLGAAPGSERCAKPSEGSCGAPADVASAP